MVPAGLFKTQLQTLDLVIAVEFLSHPQVGGPAGILYVFSMQYTFPDPQIMVTYQMISDEAFCPTEYSTFLKRGQVEKNIFN